MNTYTPRRSTPDWRRHSHSSTLRKLPITWSVPGDDCLDAFRRQKKQKKNLDFMEDPGQ
jgi:hypothetical protein